MALTDTEGGAILIPIGIAGVIIALAYLVPQISYVVTGEVPEWAARLWGIEEAANER